MAKFTRIGDMLKKNRKKLIIFISTGDTCRAPMASGYFRKLLKERDFQHIEVRDAGIMTVAGLRATAEAIQVLDTVDVDLRRHNSRKLSNESIKRADLILGMSSFHVQTALRQSEHARNKTVLLKEYVKWEHKNVQISDPMGGTLEVYKKCFQEIKEACDRLIDDPFIVKQEPVAEPAKKAGAEPAAEEAATENGKKKKSAPRKKTKKISAAKTASGDASAEDGKTAKTTVSNKKEATAPKPAAKSKASKPKKSATAKTSKSKAGARTASSPKPKASDGADKPAKKTSATKAKKKSTSSAKTTSSGKKKR